MKSPSREDLRDLLRRWAAGQLSEQEIHAEAESLWEAEEWPEVDEADDRSIPIEVLSQLDIMNHQLLMPDDIPALADFLNTPLGDALEGWRRWRRYWGGIDFDARRERLANHSFYVP